MNRKLFITALAAMLGLCSLKSHADHDTPENCVIELRHQMDSAISLKQKKQILEKLEQAGTFQAMICAGQQMDNYRLRKAAAKAAAHIALQHPEYNGMNTRMLLLAAKPYVSKKEREAIDEFFRKDDASEEGFVSLFNGKDLKGWKGLVANPIARRKMTAAELEEAQEKADVLMHENWQVIDGLLTYVGHGGDNLCTERQYEDFEMYVDWRLDPSGAEPDAGIYLRGTPQVQIWDIARVNVGAQVGSGGLYNNQKNKSIPTEVADNKLGEWNTFYIKMVGDKVTVLLNGVKVVDNVVLENYWDRSQPIFPKEQIELQAHGSLVNYRDIYIREIK